MRSHRRHALGLEEDRIYLDHGLTGTNRDRTGLRLAPATCRAADTLVAIKPGDTLRRAGRSLSCSPDHRAR
jgi:hypothetical protein